MTDFGVSWTVEGIEANEETCRLYAERSPALATALSPVIGYEAAARLVKEALAKGALVRDLAREKRLLPEKDLARLLAPRRMTGDTTSRPETV